MVEYESNYAKMVALDARIRELEEQRYKWEAYAQKLREALEDTTATLETLSYIHDGNPSFAYADVEPVEYARHMLFEARQLAKSAHTDAYIALSITPTSALASLEKTPCMSCDGTGVDLYDGTNHDCQVCAGTGIIRPSALAAVRDEVREEVARYIEGKGGKIPGTSVFASLVSGNQQPCMSGDIRDRLSPRVRKEFDAATDHLATTIRARKEIINEKVA